MKKLIKLCLLLMALLPLTVDARTITDLFASEPGYIFPLLTRTARLDMVDYYTSGQHVALPNNLGGDSELVELDSAYLKVKTSGSKVLEMCMWTDGRKDTVIAVIETVMTPLPDSRLTLWNAQWQPFYTDRLFKMPGIDDFIVKKMPRELRADLQDAMIFPLIQLTFTGDRHRTIVATHALDRFLAPDEYKRFADYLKPSLTYRFNGNKVKLVK